MIGYIDTQGYDAVILECNGFWVDREKLRESEVRKMTRKEAIDDLRVIKGFLAGLSGVTPLCFDYAIEALERKRGKWIPIKDDEHWYVLRWECSCCGFRTTSDKMANYCEDCGADMRGEEDE